MARPWGSAMDYADSWKSPRTGETYQIGDVVLVDTEAFNTATIIGFARYKTGGWYAKLARPYLYADTIGACPGFLLGAEDWEVKCESTLEGNCKRLPGSYTRGVH